MPLGILSSAATCTEEIEHLQVLRKLFRHLAQAGMTIKPSKCIFGVESVDFLGHQLQHGLHEDIMSPKSESSKTNNQEAGSFPYGIGRILPRFHPKLHNCWAPLSGLTRKGQPSK